ncbi:MAG: metal-dependent hydrolase [Candidatus Micrarchaeota archaeon]
MNWRPHFVFGCAAAAIAFILILPLLGLYEWDNPLLLMLLILFGGMSALVPDLDHHESKGKAVLDVGFVVIVAFYAYNTMCGGMGLCVPPYEAVQEMIQLFLAMVGVYFLFFRFFKPAHRGITHTVLASVLYGLIIFALLDEYFAAAAVAGYVSHLAADMHIKLA